MASRHSFSTHLSVLEDLKAPDRRDLAWKTFVDRYFRLIRFWCREWGVEVDEHDDVFQDVMIRVMGSIDNFHRVGTGSFRAWLKDLARKSWHQIERDKDRICARREVDVLRAESWKKLSSERSFDHLVELFDRWALQEIMDLAYSRVLSQVRPETWETFRLAILDGKDVDEVVALQGITRHQAYNRIFRIRRLVQDEIARIEADHSAPEEHGP